MSTRNGTGPLQSLAKLLDALLLQQTSLRNLPVQMFICFFPLKAALLAFPESFQPFS